MQAAVDHCHTAADVWAAAARVKAWRMSLKPPIRRIRIRCNDRAAQVPITRPKPKPCPGICPAKFVQETVAAHFNLTVAELISHRRIPRIVLPRHIAIYVLRQVSATSLPEIGRRFGGRDHSTAHHAIEKIGRLIEADSELRRTVQTLIEECRK